jgi:protein-L-isoaspartate(D-aspartate) O-methyltransferase
LSKARRFYAEELRVAAPVRRHPEIVKAFATVPRERFLGPGPWLIGTNIRNYRTPDRDPRWLYHNVLVSIDSRKGINNGSPELWAYLLDQLDLKPGERVLQVGAGSGYYTAIIAELVGRRGRVHAIEFEKHLAARARANLTAWPQVEIVHGDASHFDAGEVDVVVAFAGGTHPAPLWLERLAPQGRLLMPLVADDKGGFMLKAVRRRGGFSAKAVTPCWFVLAKGFRTRREADHLKTALVALKGKLPALRGLHAGPMPSSEKAKAFFSGQDFWLSMR